MSNWGRVYYTNFLSAAALLVVFPFCNGEHELIKNYAFSPPQVMLLVLSCAIGVCMSHAGKQRSRASTTHSSRLSYTAGPD
jgi:GDP-mannose transporter